MSKINEMNHNINSLYILKEILSFVKTKPKLYIIIYNKHLQKSIGVDIEYLKNKVENIKLVQKMEKEKNIY